MIHSQRPVALVTGSTRGIGKACALALARAGFHVAINGRDNEEGRARQQAMVAELEQFGIEALALPGDVSDLIIQQGMLDTRFATLGATGLPCQQRRDGGKAAWRSA